ncbi:PIN domain-containing protein [Luteirhabdus pelagi]|uniref:PIN domain-containing protein n=1 Tax=Luteirhabdus pelagi TaxID=2792783 RepID=UPI00193A0790|nr:PIN domain-containing protein [Luteirhabdus pelagi]
MITKIVLDTNIWIYLTKDTFNELLMELKEKAVNEEIKIVVNDVIIKEWHRNKNQTLKALVESIKSEYKSAIKLASHMDEPSKTEFLLSLTDYKDEEKRIEKAEKKVQEVEDFMTTCKIIKVTAEQKLFVSNLAIDKKPPFENNKNNFNDALIIRNICQDANSTFPSRYDLIYVSNNPEDFIDKKTNEVYSSLMDGMNPIRLKTVTELGLALKLAPELIEDFDDWLESELQWQAELESDIRRGK